LQEWSIKVLYYGKIRCPKSALTANFDQELVLDFPYLGFLLTAGEKTVLIDSGISEKFIVDGKAWSGFLAEGGKEFVLKALSEQNVNPEKIDLVIYTHLHNDHAANCELFPNSKIIVQEEEWKALLDPIPVERVRGDYDQSIIPILTSMNLIKIDGDMDLLDGLAVYKTAGHTRGGQVVVVNTKEGRRVLCGDSCHCFSNIFPHFTEITDMDGKKHQVTPAPEVYGPGLPSSLVYDYYAWYKTIDRIKALAEYYDPAFIIPGHDPSLISLGVNQK